MICCYCQEIHSFDRSYPLREATKDIESEFPRCDWHWRFVCSVCGKPKHFNGITWCEKTQGFICLTCAKSNKLVFRKFWKWRSYCSIECSVCNEHHAALDYLEFLGKHPWQLSSDALKRHDGLDPETTLPKPTSFYFPLGKSKVTEDQISEAWDKLAEQWDRWYTELGDTNRRHIIDPTIFRIIGSVKGMSILDAGCGNGYLCRLLAQKGAKVVGVDLSRRFIRIARRKEKDLPLGIRYYVRTMSDLAVFEDGKFDMVISNLALMDVHDLEKAIRELNRVLAKDGKLVFSIMHPCFSSPPVHGWVKKPEDSNRREDWIYWKVDRYFDRSLEIWQYFDFPPTYSFHYPLSDYVRMLIRNGFMITDFEEPVPSKEAVRNHYRELNDCDRIPWFLILGAKKLFALRKMANPGFTGVL